MGPTQHPSGCGRGWRADDHAFGRRESAASGFSIRYAGDRGRMEGTSSNHRRRPSGSCAGSRRSLRRRDAISSETGCLRVQRNDAVDLPFGVGLLGISRPSGSEMRPRCFLREVPEPTRPIPIELLRVLDRAGRKRSSLRAASEPALPAATLGSTPGIGRRSQTKPRHFAFPRRFGSRDAEAGLDPPGETSSSTGRRDTRGSIGNESIQSPWEHRAGRSGNAVPPQRTPRWNKALRSTRRGAHRGNTEAGANRTARGHASR